MKISDPMSTRVAEYLEYRRALGYSLRNEGDMLQNFARFADSSGSHGPLTCDLAMRWASLPTTADRLYRARRIEILISFGRYCQIFDARTELPPRHIFGPAHRRKTPYIYSSSQLQALATRKRGADSFDEFRRIRNATIFGLLACTGLRISEALQLLVDDVNLEPGVLTIRESKRRHYRLVPIHRSAKARLSEYAIQRNHRFPNANFFFVNWSGHQLPYTTIRSAFRELTKGPEWTKGGRRPRLHDLRHTFACRVLLKWRRKAPGQEDRIDWLSRYLGHERVSDTYWYLSAVPELFSATLREFKYPTPIDL